MKEYAIKTICTVALITLGTVLSYREGDKTVKLAFSLILICSLTLPIAPEIIKLINGGIPSFSPDGYEYDEQYSEVAEASLAEGIKKALCERFDLDEESVGVSLENFDFEKMSCDAIKVKLYGSAALANITEMKKYLGKNFEESEIRVEIG